MIGGIEETSASFEARSAPRSYPTDPHRPRAVRWRPRGRRRSVGRGEGIGQPLSRESQSPGADAVSSAEGNTFRTHHRKVRTTRRGRRTWHVQTLLAREPGDLAIDRSAIAAGSASGRRGAVADDARSREVRLCHSSWEADEQSGLDRRGAGGAKGRGQGECEPAKHAPDAEPGKCVTGAGAHTASRNEKRFAVTHPRWEPYARIGPVRICAGGRSVQ